MHRGKKKKKVGGEGKKIKKIKVGKASALLKNGGLVTFNKDKPRYHDHNSEGKGVFARHEKENWGLVSRQYRGTKLGKSRKRFQRVTLSWMKVGAYVSR